MGLLLNNSAGRAGSGGAQEIHLYAVPGQSLILMLRVDGSDAGAGKQFEVKANGAPITFDKPVIDATGPDPETLSFHSAGGFATEGTFTLTIVDVNDVERIRVKAQVVMDPNALPKPPPPWRSAVREGGWAIMMGILPIIGAAAIAWVAYLGCLRLYGVVQEANCNVCPTPVVANGKKPVADPCLVACFEKRLAEQKK